MIFFVHKSFFLFFVFIFVFYFLLNVSWSGLFFIPNSYEFVYLVFLSIFMLGIIFLSESNHVVSLFSEFIIISSLFFFFSSNFFMLYICFESVLFFIVVLIVGMGLQIEKINSSYYLIFYSIFCSFPFLYIYFSNNFFFSFCYFDFYLSWECFLFLSLSFLMKFPVYFLHLWLPKAHVEAPTSASMLLAGLLLKLGTLGFFRIIKSMNFLYLNFLFFISILGMIICSFICMFQSDSKSLAAFSSITHMSFLLLSLIFLNNFSKMSGLMMMLSHGYTSTLLFYYIGEIFHSSNTRMIYFFTSMMNNNLLFCLIFSSIFLSNSGVPPSISFFSEFVLISCSFNLLSIIIFIIGIYFFFSFYYSFFVMVNMFIGKSFYYISNMSIFFSFSLFIMMFNFFWLSFFFLSVIFLMNLS